MRTNIAFTIGLVAALQCLTSISGQCQTNTIPNYSVQEILLPFRSTITKINNKNQILGIDTSSHRSFICETNSSFTYIEGGDVIQAQDLNDSGQVVGSFSDGGFAAPFRWQNGIFEHLPILVSPNLYKTTGLAIAINNHGHAVGYSGVDLGVVRATSWNGGVENIGGPMSDPLNNVALAINSSGQIVGREFINGTSRATLNGKPLDLSSLGYGSSVGLAISDDGLVLGSLPDGKLFLYSAKDGPRIVPISAGAAFGAHDYPTPARMNSKGDFVVRTGVISLNGLTATLSLFIADKQWSVQPYSINDAGLIVGIGFLSTDRFRPRAVLLIPEVAAMDIRIDADRDGKITFDDDTDKTKPDRPYRFWLNEDRDKTVTLQLLNIPEWGSTQKDSDNQVIETTRDLEDFAQIAIKADAKIKAKIDQKYTLAIETTGGLEINIFKAWESGDGYLFDEQHALGQVQGSQSRPDGPRYYGTAVDPTRLSDWIDPKEYGQDPIPFIFEGKKAGEGTIKLVLKKPDGTVESSAEVHIKLTPIKGMYERVRATPESDAAFPAPYEHKALLPAIGLAPQSPSVATNPPLDETKQCIVYIHGWNLSLWECENWAETMYKRLWWQGYKGRFAAFRWTPKMVRDGKLQLARGSGSKDFNWSEYRALKYAEALRDYIQDLRGRGFRVNLVAHSQGNMVASEAVRLGAPVDTCILMQAAVSAGCYDSTPALDLKMFLDAERKKKNKTPDGAQELGYRGYFQNIGSTLINFYNPNDFALVAGQVSFAGFTQEANWRNNQLVFKPFDNYSYDFKTRQSRHLRRVLGDPHEVMSMVARSRTHALGAEGQTAGKLNRAQSINMGANFGFTDSRLDHNAQFYRNIQELKAFYTTLLESMFGANP